MMRAATGLFVFLLSLIPVVGVPGFAAAQQQEKRIALVVGNGAYAKSPLATAANDAGLIAQTLQAAGFDVVGARDLDGDTLRKSFRDFMQKAETSGPGTVAMVYLAGYGVQLAGENYFIPVDAPIGRENDIPVEGLRIGDYLRLMASLPLKAGIVVLDAARPQPFIEGGQPIASGLALIEPEPHMLIAYNAAPGTVAPVEQGAYGTYAQSLAEMIRTGGLPLPELFDRVRLRVNETSKGAQVPWHAHKLDSDFFFFDRAPDAPVQAPPDQVAAIRNKPIRDLGVQDAYAAALERDTLPAYEEFIAAYPDDPIAKRVRALAAARREAIVWQRTYRADTPEAYWSYLRRYPNGPHAADARRRLAILTAPPEPPPSFAMYEYDVPPPPPEEIVYVDRPVLAFSDPYFDFAPPPPPPVFFLPPPPPEFVVLEPPPPPIGLFILPQPIFVPIPIYVRPPVYVRPPQNNIIFSNIHNRRMIDTVINRPPPQQPVQGSPGSPNFRPQPGAKGGAGIPVAAPGAASPALPPSVAQRATLIREGKAPPPPSASINPAVRPGAQPTPNGPPGARGGAAANAPLPANVAPTAPAPGQALPKANALPVPGTKGAPPPPPSTARGPAGAGPQARPGVPPAQPGTAPSAATAPGAAGPQGARGPGGPGGPIANVPPVGGQPKAGGPDSVGVRPGAPDSARRPGAVPPPPPAAANLPARPGPAVAPKPAPTTSPAVRAPPPPPVRPAPQMARPTPAPPPPPRIAAPPPPRPAAPPPQMAPRPAAPPPMARPVAPPPQMARPVAPPPMARPAAPPPQMARPMAPPPMARPAAPPPAAAVKRCPPGVPRC
jgi:uncharacterized caspase-like protein